jgi:dihydrolipoamide dehydrogenase
MLTSCRKHLLRQRCQGEHEQDGGHERQPRDQESEGQKRAAASGGLTGRLRIKGRPGPTPYRLPLLAVPPPFAVFGIPRRPLFGCFFALVQFPHPTEFRIVAKVHEQAPSEPRPEPALGSGKLSDRTNEPGFSTRCGSHLAADKFDVAILGGGTGGYTAAIRAAQLGKHTVLVEAERLGGCCLNQGCIPTKVMLESSGLYERVAVRGRDFGLQVESPGIDLELVADRRRRVVGQLQQGVQGLMRKNRIEVVPAWGTLTAAKAIQTSDRAIEATSIILATGSAPKSLPGIEFDGKRIISSDHAVQASSAPGSIVIIGAGAIGVEFATYYRQLGAKVTLLEALDRLVPLEDEEVSAALLQSFRKQGIECRTGVRVKGARSDEHGVTVILEGGEVSAEQLLVAVGRRPCTDGLGLEAVGVKTDSRGFIVVDEWLRTTAPGIWAIGDAVGGFLLAHAAAHEGVIAAEDIAGQRLHPMEQDLVTRCTYSSPEMASVGLTEQQARDRGHEIKVGKFPFAANARALIHGEPAGFAKLVSDARTGQILGAHLIGIQATELIAEPALARLFQGDPWEVGRNIHPHPTLSEVFGEAALAVDGSAINI